MVTLSREAQGDLERYLRQVKGALRGHRSVDVGEVERDVLSHVEAELSGQPEPIDSSSLRPVLARLGTPEAWVPAEDLPPWRRLLNRLHSGPEDWRLAYATFVSFVAGFWLPPLLIASLPVARATLAQLSARNEPIGARKWLVYPPLVLWYAAFAALLLIGPTPLPVVALEDWRLRNELAAYVGPFWMVVPAAAVLTLGLWWTIFGQLLRRFEGAVRVVFWPFADWFEARHARLLSLAGVVLMTVAGATLAALAAWTSRSR